MTTISLKQNHRSSLFLKLLITGIIGLLAGIMYLYNFNVNLRHEVQNKSDFLRKTTILNADLKDRLYKITDVKILNSLILKKNLVEDKNPYYFKEGTLLWVAVR